MTSSAVATVMSGRNNRRCERCISKNTGVTLSEARTTAYRIVGNPAGSFLAEIPFRLDKAAKVPGPDILSNIPKGTDAVHPREFRVGNPGNLIFIDVTFVHPDASEEEISAAFKPNTKALFGETISNPSLEVLDIEKFARIAHSHGVPLIVDNTFPTPINCRPFERGRAEPGDYGRNHV